MSDPSDFTPKELFQISLYKDPKVLFSKTLTRTLWYLVPSVVLSVYSLVTGETAYCFFAFCILLFQTISRLVLLKRGSGTVGNIIRKYEAKIEKLESSR